MIDGDSNCRVVFRGQFQRNMFNDIKKTAGKGWVRKLSALLERNVSVICDYSSGKCMMNLQQVNMLCRKFRLDERLISSKISELRHPNWGSVKGAETTNKRHAEKLGIWGKKGAYAIQTKYPQKRLEWIKKAIMAAGKRGATVQPPTFFESKVMKRLPRKGLAVHVPFELDGECINVDFVYNGIPMEAMTNPHNKGEMFYRLIDAKRKSDMLKRKMILIFEDYDAHPDAILHALEIGMVPASIENMSNIKNYLLTGRKGFLKDVVSRAESCALKAIERRKRQIHAAAIRECGKIDEIENAVHEKLKQTGAKGKVALQSKYGTFAVPDDCIFYKSMKYAVLVTKRSGSTSGIRAAFRDHCGYAYMLKRLYGRFKVISVIITPRTFKLRTGKAFKLYDKHVDCSIVGTLDHVLNGLEMLDLNTLKRQQ